MVVGRTIFFPIHLFLHCIGDVVIAWYIEKRHLQLFYIGLELCPFLLNLVRFFRISFDKVTYRHDKFGLKQIDLLHGLGKYFRAMATGSVADNCKAEVIRVVVHFQTSPGVFISDLNLKFFFEGWLFRKSNSSNKHYPNKSKNHSSLHHESPANKISDINN